MPAHTVAITGAKGGVGKTTTSLNLASALAADGLAVALVETDLAMANLVDFVPLAPEATLHDVLAGEATMAEARYEAPTFDVYPSGTSLEGFAATDPARLPDAIESIEDDYDVILFDTSAGVSHESMLPSAIADATLLVSTPRVSSVRDATKTAEIVTRVGGEVIGIAFTRSGSGNSPPPARIAEFIDVPLLGHVPDDPAVPEAQDAERPVVEYAPDSTAAISYRTLAHALLEELGEDPHALGEDDTDDGEARTNDGAAHGEARTDEGTTGDETRPGDEATGDDRTRAVDRTALDRVDPHPVDRVELDETDTPATDRANAEGGDVHPMADDESDERGVNDSPTVADAFVIDDDSDDEDTDDADREGSEDAERTRDEAIGGEFETADVISERARDLKR